MNLASFFDPDEVPSEWWWERMRIYRDRLLAASDWAMMPDAPTDKTAWQEYRQALRDFPATWEPGPVADFPNPPGYVEPEIIEPEVVEDSVPPVEALAEETEA